MSPPTRFAQAEAERETLKLTLDSLELLVIQNETAPLEQAIVENSLELGKQTQAEIMDNQRSLQVLATNEAAIAPYKAEYPDLLTKAMKFASVFKGLSMKFPVASSSRAGSSSSAASTTPSADIRLPRIEIPHFKGELGEWIAFRDMFEKAIDSNATLSKAQKLTYLKSYLHGEAYNHISSLFISDANYDVAWSTLTNRYQDDRQLLFSLLQRLMAQPIVSTPTSAAVRSLVDTTQACVRGLEVLNIKVEHWDAILVYILFTKMDPTSKELWEHSLPDNRIPVLKNIVDFLEQRARALAAGSTVMPPRQGRDGRKVHSHHTQQQNNFKCVLSCSSLHPLSRCQKFIDMDVSKRADVIRRNSLCFNCMSSGHGVQRCPSTFSCRKCKERHHTMIHKESRPATQPAAQPVTGPPSALAAVPTVSSYQANSDVNPAILATARIRILDADGQPHHFRALLDGGSSVSLISEGCAKRLRLTLNPSDTQITGVSATSVGLSSSETSFVIKPHFRSSLSYTVNALVLTRLTSKIPIMKINPDGWEHLHDLRLADPEYTIPAPVDVLLGSDIFWHLLKAEKIAGPPTAPLAIRSTLGWLVAGPNPSTTRSVTSFMTTISLEETVQKFWEAEGFPETPVHSHEEQECETFFEDNFQRINGRFTVKIPWKTPDVPIGASRENALRRLYQLEKRFRGTSIKDAEKLRRIQHHHEEYKKFMLEYEQMGHMSEIPSNELSVPAKRVNYVPHHFVLKESSTTALRVVFDGSSKTSSGFSINEAMMIGPTLQDPLQSILLRFRKHPIAYTADIAKMYRQIKVSKEDTDTQRILWRPDPAIPVKEYRLNTVTYGTASAPYLAVKCLQKLSQLEETSLPIASRKAAEDFYVDDLMSGDSTQEQAIIAIKQLNAMCSIGGFPLRKWSCNDQKVLDTIPMDLRETTSLIDMDISDTIQTLGLRWKPSQDTYHFSVNLPHSTTGVYTKRMILSEISMIFDPLGWLSPVIVGAKILLQDLWRTKLDWSDPVPDSILQRWITLKNSLKYLEKLVIPRCIMPGNPTKCILCGFCDSSEKSYSAVTFTVCFYNNEKPTSHLVTSKTKVAPMQQLTLARLELLGAVLLSRLIKSTVCALKHDFSEIRLFTDSTIVLGWVNSSPVRWKTYVRNRVQFIQDAVPDAKWYHVPGCDNPADCASRGITPQELLHHPLWWRGNSRMCESSLCETPPSNNALDPVKNEEHPTVQVHAVSTTDSVLNRFSSYNRLVRVVAWMLRFVTNSRANIAKTTGALTVTELNSSFNLVMRLAQKESFSTEIAAIKAKKEMPRSSKLSSLHPFIDDQNILRVGGRLENAAIPESQKHPILLPPRHLLTKLLIRDLHQRYFHAGAQLVMTLLQQRFWLFRAKDAVRHEIRKCVLCTRYRGETMKQFMGNLPKDRVTPSQPFSKCGVDYAGPFQTRPPTRSTVTLKSYLAIFVCFVTRAMHIEVVQSLSTDSFLAALRRFISRRGRPTDIFSDNGTNFVGANRAIKEIVKLCSSSQHNTEVADMCSSIGVQWHFSPPVSPHFGGLYEAGVRSVKHHLKRVIGVSRFTYEELLTLVIQIEALLNSRPLVPISTDSAELDILTPAHFLIGAPLTALPDPDVTEINPGRLSRWQLLQQQKQIFWRRWSREYLTRLQNRPKWMNVSRNISVNDVVIIKEDNLPPAEWSIARVIATHPGADGHVRVATVKTSKGEYKRAIHKLCLLPLESSITESN